MALDREFGAGNWEIRLRYKQPAPGAQPEDLGQLDVYGNPVSPRVTSAGPVRFSGNGEPALTPAQAAAYRHPTHDPNYIPPSERGKPARAGQSAGRPRPGAEEETICADCGEKKHPKKYKRCFDCRLRADGIDPDEIVTCAECGEGTHPARYTRCYACLQAGR